jgi:cytochrome c-type biogenesis protein
MVDSPSLALAFAAGFVSFVSPCVLPLVPGYLAAVTGTQPGAREGPGPKVDRRTVGRSLLFVGTFSLIFICLGLSATTIGSFLFHNKPVLNRVAGISIVVMGLLLVGSVFVLRLNREFRPSGLIERAGRGGPVVAGAAFAIAWTPCVGPTLGAILTLSTNSPGLSRGALLLAVYSLGLAVPFLFSAVAFSAAQRSFAFFKRHYAAIQIVSGVVLVVMGVLVYNGELTRLNGQAQQWLDGLGLNIFNL